MASPKTIDTDGKSVWWWVFCMPGAVVMWFRYMNPESVRDSFGTARRQNVVLFQFITTMFLYLLLYLALTHIEVTKNIFGILLLPFAVLFSLFKG